LIVATYIMLTYR